MSFNSLLAVLKSSIDDSPDCRVALFPVENSTDGSLSYDVSRYLSIQSVGFGISHYCVEAMGIPGLQGTGGIDSAGYIVAPRDKRSAVSSFTRHYPSSVTTP